MSSSANSSRFDVEVFSGKPYFEERPVGLPFNSLQDGPQAIYFRPQDTIVEEPTPGLINGVVRSLRRSGAARRLELAIGVNERIVEAEAPTTAISVSVTRGLRLKRGGAFALPARVRRSIEGDSLTYRRRTRRRRPSCRSRR